jgi:5-methyltetrahydropteroyltriglutamate--homocysteine methyltransferase
MMFETSTAGSLPKPAWLATPKMLWAPWAASGDALVRAKRDATVLTLKEQEDIGLDIVSDGEQSRQHFVHGFLEGVDGIDFGKRIKMGIRNNRYEAEVPSVTGALKRRGSVHKTEAVLARAHTKHKLKFTLPGPMTICDTVADAHYGSRAAMAMRFAEILNEEARELEAAGCDVIQFDEPAFNVYMSEVVEWGVAALNRAVEGLRCKTAVHICYGYGIKANIDWKAGLGGEWRQYEEIFPALAQSRIGQVSLECIHSRVPANLMALLKGKDVLVGAIDVASEQVETPEEVAAVLKSALRYVPAEKLLPCTNCGMAPLDRKLARDKMRALVKGAALLRAELGGKA